jgi:hypothetical protein
VPKKALIADDCRAITDVITVSATDRCRHAVPMYPSRHRSQLPPPQKPVASPAKHRHAPLSLSHVPRSLHWQRSLQSCPYHPATHAVQSVLPASLARPASHTHASDSAPHRFSADSALHAACEHPQLGPVKPDAHAHTPDTWHVPAELHTSPFAPRGHGTLQSTPAHPCPHTHRVPFVTPFAHVSSHALPAKPPRHSSHRAPVKRASHSHVRLPGAQLPCRLQSHTVPHPVAGHTHPGSHTHAPVAFAPSSHRPCPPHAASAHPAEQSARPKPAAHRHVLVAASHSPCPLHGVAAPPGHDTLQYRPDHPPAHSHDPSPDLPSTHVLCAASHRHCWSQPGPNCPAAGHDWHRPDAASITTSQNLPQYGARHSHRPDVALHVPLPLHTRPSKTGHATSHAAPACVAAHASHVAPAQKPAAADCSHRHVTDALRHAPCPPHTCPFAPRGHGVVHVAPAHSPLHVHAPVAASHRPPLHGFAAPPAHSCAHAAPQYPCRHVLQSGSAYRALHVQFPLPSAPSEQLPRPLHRFGHSTPQSAVAKKGSHWHLGAYPPPGTSTRVHVPRALHSRPAGPGHTKADTHDGSWLLHSSQRSPSYPSLHTHAPVPKRPSSHRAVPSAAQSHSFWHADP